jgi:hypothetical protein
MNIFGTSKRGCFVAFNLGTERGRGAVLSLPTTEPGNSIQLPVENDYTFPLVVTNVAISQKERAFFLNCFNNRIYTYAFGTDIGSVTVDYIGFLASGVLGASAAVDDDEVAPPAGEREATEIVLDAYRQSRISASKQFATLSFGTNGFLRGFVTNMNSQTANAETNLQSFQIILTTVEVQGAIGNELRAAT